MITDLAKLQTKSDSINPFGGLFSIFKTFDKSGTELVQLYISDCEASVERPVKELKDFRKVFLKAGEFKVLVGSASDDIRTGCTFTY